MSGLSKAYQEAMDKINNKIEEAIEKACVKRYVVYSAHDFDEYDTPIDNLDEVPVEGKIQFINEDEDWKSSVWESPTWLQIAVMVNYMIIETEDYYRVYLEDFEVIGNENGVMIAKLMMGY